MLITKLILHLSKRLAFNGIKTMTYEPHKTHQLILGTNGSGKSTIMAELSPLPANPQDFFTGGYKLIELTHKGKSYVLQNTFSGKGGGRHSFLCDDQELNVGATVTVQKQLVQEHFNLDQELFDLLIGLTNFREMSPTQRRRWLVKMADDNMGDAIHLFNQVKSELRDKQAVLKHLSTNIVDMTIFNKETTEREESLIKAKKVVDDLADGLQKLLIDLPKPEDKNPLSTIGVQTTLLDKHHRLLHNARRVSDMDKYLGEDLDKQKHQAQAKIEVYRKQREVLDKEAESIQDVIRMLTKEGASNLDDLIEKQQQLLDAKQTIQVKIGTYTKGNRTADQVTRMVNQTNAVTQVLADILMELPDNSTGIITRDKAEEIRQLKEVQLSKRGELMFQIAKVKHLLSHFNQDNTSTCPVCNHTYYLGVEGHTQEGLQTTLDTQNEALNTTEKTIAQCDEYQLQVADYTKQYRRLTTLMDDYPDLAPVWENVRKVSLTQQHPSVIQDLFNQWQQDVLLWVDEHRLEENLQNIGASIEALKSKVDESTNLTHERLNTIQAESTHLGQLMRDLHKDITTIEEIQQLQRNVKQYSDAVMDSLKKINQAEIDHEMLALIDFIRQELNHAAREQNRLTDEHNDLIQYRTRMIELHQQVKDVSKDIETLKVLSDELSPVNGLIADYSLSFVKQFTDQMNSIINTIWTYDMQIRPSAVNDDLTYKFPLYMANSDTETPDINRASTAQKGIIDFAFKLLLISYLGLQDFPLYLDELTPNLDETHRINIMAFVRDFVESGQCSQMFMISHYVDGNNVFPQAEFVILNDSNLLNKPLTFNTNVTLTYQ